MALIEVDSYDAFSEQEFVGRHAVYFTASWCAPCRTAAPMISRIADSGEAMDIIKVDVDVLPELVERFDVMGVPTFIVFDDNDVETARQVGITKAQEMRDLLAK